MGKCRFFNCCKYSGGNPTCNDENEANGYCGAYDQFIESINKIPSKRLFIIQP